MATTALLSTVVTGAALMVIIALVLRLRDWRQPAPGAAGAAGLVRRANGPLGWSIAFFVVAFGVMGLGMAYAAGEPVAGLDPGTLGLLALGVLAVVFGVGSIIAVHAAVRSRGLNSAQAAGVSSVLLATLVLVAITAQLLLG